MNANPSNTDSAFEAPASATGSGARPNPVDTFWDFFVCFVVAALGILCGAIVAFFIGLSFGWIDLGC